jgi:hypothetical protein
MDKERALNVWFDIWKRSAAAQRQVLDDVTDDIEAEAEDDGDGDGTSPMLAPGTVIPSAEAERR